MGITTATLGSQVLNSASWTKRRYGVYLLGKTRSMQAFRILATRLGVEKDGDVINAINSAMSSLRTRLK
ncbi:MAG: hypothetical protein HN509_10820 [Halobacteriovoraceae bacterium]|nr:hypothetical protein [Halobacteriovoraceae bacterium]